MRKHKAWFYVGLGFIFFVGLASLYEQIVVYKSQPWYSTLIVIVFVAIPFLCGLKSVR